MVTTDAMLKKLESAVDTCMEAEFAKDEIMAEFHKADWFNEGYYKRHILECVIRIHMNNELDARAVQAAAINNISAAKQLSYYLYDEFGHDEMFGQDLNIYGYAKSDIQAENAFPETWKLMGYLNLCVSKFGPLAAITWDWFLEYYGDKYNPFITQKASANMGQPAVNGAASHVAFDEAEDHSGMMNNMLSSVIKDEKDLEKAVVHIKAFVPMVGEYFQALRAATL
ncbi:hypothetical protein PCO86_13050 [Pectobacteriaceae bacterium CE70]|uniref:Mangotoxin biosynthesis protein MboA n=1 Tax=Serratia sp. (strain ATCC 39006) TaxID=104623 RepID=A0A2I5T923_SERS3|nr:MULTISPECIES: hypothetical protein [Enterobacterales]WJV59976.1 hypothetical protein PCO84_09620 [Pectobacteriaceae bacterium C111]WJV64314.1 hypothetical protein PCO87_10000 [Pectobacteriaceae bacterium C52]WJV65255.1 hypothetical protein PCO86_13050 [Pectobacteriaceae bacterium CE70]WJY09270.1 hypothetical protein PCO80_12925 [Pectobacteriaceae bacterium C80]WJY13322.1 hypothetical protein PCO82_12040 [Pectobacteriaceae bacterium CE90]